MHIQHSDFGTSPALRTSLKRGLARQAIAHAARDEADLPAIFAATCSTRPNRKAMERMAIRLQRKSGVVRCVIAEKSQGLVLIVRNLREVFTRVESVDVFAETALIYTRISIRCSRLGAGFHLSRASFCLHALERLVERSTLALECPLLDALDTEAAHLLRGLTCGRLIEDQGDCFGAAVEPGVWAGSVDETALEEEWGLVYASEYTRIPVFSARTFLSPQEMRPTTWLKWNGDPSLQGTA